jgi:hypothetical protein
MLRTLGVIAALCLSLVYCSGCGGASGSSAASTPAATPTAGEGVGSGPSAAEKRTEAKQEQHYERLIERERQRSLRKQARESEQADAAANRVRAEAESAERILEEEEKARAQRSNSAGQSSSPNSEASTCGSYGGKNAFACEDSYEVCSIEAPAVVEKAYHEQGPSFDSWALHYAKETYTGHANPFEDIVWEAGYAGCLAAISAEYERLYR